MILIETILNKVITTEMLKPGLTIFTSVAITMLVIKFIQIIKDKLS